MSFAAALTAGLSFLAVGLYTLLARRRRFVDTPGTRSSHTLPTPTGAGIALVATLAVMLVWIGVEPGASRIAPVSFPESYGWLVAGAACLSLVGLWDDARGLPARWRLLVQVILSTGLSLLLPLPSPWLVPLLVLFLTWTMNAFNFMDGSDGLAGMQALAAGLMLAGLFHVAGEEGLALAALSVAAVALGFLPWNLPPARCFMGDAGSVPLGWLLGGLALVGVVQGSVALPAAIGVMAVFHVDAGLTLVRRVWRGERWYTAHRTHVYQMLMAQGWKHGQVLLAYAALNLLVVAPAVVVAALKPSWGWAATLVALMSLAIAWCVVSLKLGERP